MALDAQFGQIYNNLQVSGRIDIPTGIPTSYRIVGSLSSFDYLTNGKFFNAGNDPIFNKKDEQFVKLMVSLPFLSRQKAEFSVGVAGMEDQYFQTKVIDFTNAKRDASNYTIFGGSVALDGNTLNSRQYATSDAGNGSLPIFIRVRSITGPVWEKIRIREDMNISSHGCNCRTRWSGISTSGIISRWVLISRDIILRGTSVIITGLP